MKVLMILESWGSGGTEAYVEALSRAFPPEYELHLVLLKGDVPELCSGRPFASCRSCSAQGLSRYLWLRRVVAELSPEICHMHLYSSMLPVAVSLLGVKGPRKVLSFHSPVSAWSLRHRLGFRLAATMMDALVGASEQTAKELKGWNKTVKAISPPIELPDELQTGDPERRSVAIVGCGRLSKEKDWPILIQAFASQRGQGLPLETECWLIGDGDERQGLEELTESLGVTDAVKFLGKMPREDLLLKLQEAAVFVLPSTFEGFGMAAVEAMGVGVPTITSDFPASAEYIVEGKTGSRFSRGNKEELGNLLVKYLIKREWAEEIGMRGRESVRERYLPRKVAEKHEKVYQELLD